jgi:hypothetical protein
MLDIHFRSEKIHPGIEVIRELARTEDFPDRKFMMVVRDEDTLEDQVFNFTHSNHSLVRASQRGIDRLRMETTLKYGKSVYRQGMEFCILGSRDIPDSLSHMRDKLEGTVVVLGEESGCVITCYRGRNPYKRIKRKSKRLYRMAA